MTSRIRDSNGRLLPAPRSARRGGHPGFGDGKTRVRSTKPYRAEALQYVALARRGHLRAQRMLAMIRRACKLEMEAQIAARNHPSA